MFISFKNFVAIAVLVIPSFALPQSIPIDGGSVSISESGSISGSWSVQEDPVNFPEEVDTGSVSGSISPSGTISGSFSGNDRYNENLGGTVALVDHPYSGSVSGTIDEDGNYTVNWSGPEPGSRSGTLPGFSLPGSGDPGNTDEPDEPGDSDDPGDTSNADNQTSSTDSSNRDELLSRIDDSLKRIEEIMDPQNQIPDGPNNASPESLMDWLEDAAQRYSSEAYQRLPRSEYVVSVLDYIETIFAGPRDELASWREWIRNRVVDANRPTRFGGPQEFIMTIADEFLNPQNYNNIKETVEAINRTKDPNNPASNLNTQDVLRQMDDGGDRVRRQMSQKMSEMSVRGYDR